MLFFFSFFLFFHIKHNAIKISNLLQHHISGDLEGFFCFLGFWRGTGLISLLDVGELFSDGAGKLLSDVVGLDSDDDGAGKLLSDVIGLDKASFT